MKEVSKKTIEELNEEINEKRVSLRDIRFGDASKSKNVMVQRQIKKDIARLETQKRNTK